MGLELLDIIWIMLGALALFIVARRLPASATHSALETLIEQLTEANAKIKGLTLDIERLRGENIELSKRTNQLQTMLDAFLPKLAGMEDLSKSSQVIIEQQQARIAELTAEVEVLRRMLQQS